MADKTLSGSQRIKNYLLENVGRKLHTRQIMAISGVADHARALRTLRAKGWPIQTHHDNAGLKSGEYLLSGPPGLPRGYNGGISKRVRAEVLERDGGVCQACGRAAGEFYGEIGRTAHLHVGHITDKSLGGGDEMSNLRALCSDCNEGIQNHADIRPDFVRVWSQVRRANGDVQMQLYQKLQKKFHGRP